MRSFRACFSNYYFWSFEKDLTCRPPPPGTLILHAPLRTIATHRSGPPPRESGGGGGALKAMYSLFRNVIAFPGWEMKIGQYC